MQCFSLHWRSFLIYYLSKDAFWSVFPSSWQNIPPSRRKRSVIHCRNIRSGHEIGKTVQTIPTRVNCLLHSLKVYFWFSLYLNRSNLSLKRFFGNSGICLLVWHHYSYLQSALVWKVVLPHTLAAVFDFCSKLISTMRKHSPCRRQNTWPTTYDSKSTRNV